MRVTSVKIYQYRLPILSPFIQQKKSLNIREGAILHIESDKGAEGFGEIAPLPGVNRETLDQALDQIENTKSFLLEQAVPGKVEKLDGKFERWLGQLALKPSVRCAIEMAILHMIANSQHKSMAQLINDASHPFIRINGLLEGSTNDVCAEATRLLNEGFTGLKLKVGGHETKFDDEVEKVKRVSRLCGERALLHLDANQSWDVNQAIAFGQAIGCTTIDYIEEPFKDVTHIAQFFDQTTIPVALDESILKLSFGDISHIDGVYTLILKPTALGGFERTWFWMQEARKRALQSVISSSFESDLGILALANLASCSGRDDHAGLDTLKFFTEHLTFDPVTIQKGRITTNQKLITSKDIDFSKLELI